MLCLYKQDSPPSPLKKKLFFPVKFKCHNMQISYYHCIKNFDFNQIQPKEENKCSPSWDESSSKGGKGGGGGSLLRYVVPPSTFFKINIKYTSLHNFRLHSFIQTAIPQHLFFLSNSFIQTVIPSTPPFFFLVKFKYYNMQIFYYHSIKNSILIKFTQRRKINTHLPEVNPLLKAAKEQEEVSSGMLSLQAHFSK